MARRYKHVTVTFDLDAIEGINDDIIALRVESNIANTCNLFSMPKNIMVSVEKVTEYTNPTKSTLSLDRPI